MTSDLGVTIIIPAYNAANFIERAIDSALSQTHSNTSVIVSIDLGDDNTAEVVGRYSDEPRIEIIEQTARLGWVGNVNALLDQVTTPFFCTVFHDDSVAANYVERLLGILEENPAAIAAGTAVRHSGDQANVVKLVDVKGTVFDRMAAIMSDPSCFFSLKALHRSAPLADGVRLPQLGQSNIQADVPFMLTYARYGTFVATDDELYLKAIWSGSVTGTFRQLEAAKWLAEHSRMTANVIDIIHKTSDLTTAEKRQLTQLALLRPNPRLLETADEDAVYRAANLIPLYTSAVFAALCGNPIEADDLNDPAGVQVLLGDKASKVYEAAGRRAAEVADSEAANAFSVVADRSRRDG